MMVPRIHDEIIAFTETCLEQHGDNARGVGWFRGDSATRYRMMLDVIRPPDKPVTVLDFGCGASHLYEHIQRRGLGHIRYSGLDLSDAFLHLSRRKYPDVTYYDTDLLDPAGHDLPSFDYVIMSGILTYKGTLSDDAMFEYLQRLIHQVSTIATIGIAFNCMSKQVEWEREELFHLPVDRLLTFLSREISRHVTIRHDYGLYEYTTYVYKTPSDEDQQRAKPLLNPGAPVEQAGLGPPDMAS